MKLLIDECVDRSNDVIVDASPSYPSVPTGIAPVFPQIFGSCVRPSFTPSMLLHVPNDTLPTK